MKYVLSIILSISVASAQTGLVMMWSGAVADIPAGWQLADGTNGTTDMRHLFVKGADTGGQPGGTGGDSLFTPAGVASWPAGVPTFAGTASTVVVTHTHIETINNSNTGGTAGFSRDASTTTSTASGYSTGSTGSANYTPAGTIAWPAGVLSVSGTQVTRQPRTYRIAYIQSLSTVTTTVPTGAITMWAGALGDIPAGYQLCDGTNSTPDLRGKFVKGVPASTEPGETFGDSVYTPAATLAFPAGVPTFTGTASTTVVAHTHTMNINSSQSAGVGIGWTYDASTNTGGASGYSTGNPTTKGTANITPTGTVAWPANPPTAAGTQTSNSEPRYYKLAFIMKTA